MVRTALRQDFQSQASYGHGTVASLMWPWHRVCVVQYVRRTAVSGAVHHVFLGAALIHSCSTVIDPYLGFVSPFRFSTVQLSQSEGGGLVATEGTAVFADPDNETSQDANGMDEDPSCPAACPDSTARRSGKRGRHRQSLSTHDVNIERDGSYSSSRAGALQQAAGTVHAALQMRAATAAGATPCPRATCDAAPGDTAHRRRAVTGQTHRLAAQPTRYQGKGKHRGIRRNTRAARSWGTSAEGRQLLRGAGTQAKRAHRSDAQRRGRSTGEKVCVCGRPARGGAAAHEGDTVGAASTESRGEPGVLAALLGAVTTVLREAVHLGAQRRVEEQHDHHRELLHLLVLQLLSAHSRVHVFMISVCLRSAC